MAGLSDYYLSQADQPGGMRGWNNMLNTPPEILQKRAMMGDPSAIKEMVARGMQPPPVAGPQRIMNRGAPTQPMAAPPPGLETPPYLDRGTSRDMARPGNGVDPGAAAFERAGRQLTPGMSGLPPELSVDIPPYLSQPKRGQNPGTMPGQPSGSEVISSLANGNDAAGVIQAGADQADEDAGMGDPMQDLGPLGPIASAIADAEDAPEGEDKYGSYIDSVIQKLMQGSDPKSRRNMALANAGFAMAASGSPFFLQGVGIGGQAGLKSYQEAEDKDLENQVRAGTLAGQESGRLETKRSNRAQEGLEGDRNAETARANQATEGLQGKRLDEDSRHNRVAESIDRGRLAISSQSNEIALQNLAVSKAELDEKKREFDAGQIGEKEYKAAQTRYLESQAKAQDSLEVSRNTEVLYGKDGTASLLDKSTGKAVPITDADGKPVQVMPKGGSGATALQKNVQSYIDWGLAGTEAEAVQLINTAKSWTPEQRLAKAQQLAQDRAANYPGLIGAQADAQIQQWTKDINSLLGSAGEQSVTPQGADGAAGAAQYTSPEQVKADYKAGKITKQQATEFIGKLTAPQQ